jgi:hypothetical protein
MTDVSPDIADAGLAPESHERRSSREAWLAVAAITFSVSQGLSLTGSISLLTDMLRDLATRGLIVAQSLDVAGDLVRVVGFAAAVVAFLGRPRDRAGRLQAGLIRLAAGYLAWCLGDLVTAFKYARTSAGGAYVAGHIVLGVSDLVLAAAAATAAGGFAGARCAAGEARARRDSRLRWSSVFLAVGILFAAISSLLFAVAFSQMGAISGFAAGFAIAAVGDAIGMGGPLIAAVWFLRSPPSHEHGRAEPRGDRVGFLSAALAVLAVGLTISAVGGIQSASASAVNGFDTSSLTAAWLDVSRQIGWAAGVGLASVAFLLPRRMPPLPRPDNDRFRLRDEGEGPRHGNELVPPAPTP